jgi:hypothetical protein
MINPTGEKLEKVLFRIFDEATEGIDIYDHNGSLWLIFTDEMRWVVEYTKEQTLWYNYYFFKNEMEMVGLDCVNNKNLIQKWFELRFLNINPVEDTIQNGVKHTPLHLFSRCLCVEDTIQNGVKHTLGARHPLSLVVEDTIQNGVKEINGTKFANFKDAIKNGIKETKEEPSQRNWMIEQVLENGVKEIHDDCTNNIARVEGIVRVGEKLS